MTSSRRSVPGGLGGRGERVDLTMAYVGTRQQFERAGFTLASPTDAVSGGFPRVVVRRALA